MYILLPDGKEFTTYQLDSISTIKERIAIERNILPEYIHLELKDNIIVSLKMLHKIMEEYQISHFQDFYDKYNSTFNIDFITMSKLWFIYRVKAKKNINQYEEFMLDEYLKTKNYTLTRLENDMKDFNTVLKNKIQELSHKVKKDLQMFNKFENYEEIHSTPLEIVKTKTEITFEVDYDIYELFNRLKLSRDVPFAVIGDYYKILKDFIPLDKWTYTKEKLEGDFQDKKDVLFLKILNVRNEPLFNLKKTTPNLYSTVSIYFESPLEESIRKRNDRIKKEKIIEEKRKKEEEARKEEEKKVQPKKILKTRQNAAKLKELEEKEKKRKEQEEKERIEKERRDEEERKRIEEEKRVSEENPNDIIKSSKVFLRVESPVSNDFSVDDLLRRITSIFPSHIDIITKNQIQIKGEFLIPNFHFDKPLFLDAVMNDPIFSSLLAVDERLKIKKDKGVYLYFSQSLDEKKDDDITCSITEQIVEKTNLKIQAKDSELKVDTPYIRIRITKVKDEDTAEKFKSIFTRFMNFYIDKKGEIINNYKLYISDIEKIIENLRVEIDKKKRKSTRTKKMLKDVNPDQFISGYSRWLCPSFRAPKIIDESDVKAIEDENQIIKFPKIPQEGTQYNYSCHHHKQYKYIGLRNNKLSNSEKYPIVPCCYKKDHRGKKSSILRQYYEENKNFADFKIKELGEKDEKHLYITNKILPPKRYGILIRNINEYFKSIDINHTYLRLGVTRSCNSVIEVLLTATDEKFNNLSSTEKKQNVENVRQKLINNLNNIYQEAYIYNKDTIKTYLQDNGKYLDPKIFIKALEDYFKRYIFIFSQNEKHPYGILNCPTHIKEYLEYEKKEKYETIFIYEHIGAELDNVTYPQCELIVQVDEYDKKEYNFKNNFEVVKRIKETFDMMYLNNQPSLPVLKFTSKLTSQGIDYNGKTRFLQLQLNNFEICLLCDPIPPLNLEQGYNYKPISQKEAFEFLKVEKITEYKDHIIQNKKVGMYFVKDKINFYIPINPVDNNNLNEIDIITPTFIFPKSQLSIYNKFHQQARYLVEYMMYLFSLDYIKYKPEELNTKYLKEFIKRNIEIKKDFKYGNVSRLFDLNSGVLHNKKLILHNENILKKLIYNLKLRMRNNLEEVKRYSEHKYIQSYYNDIKDFSQNDNEPIINSQNALHKWIKNKKLSYELHDNVIHSSFSLLDELKKFEEDGKLFIVVFIAKWDKASKSLMDRIYSPNIIEGKKYLSKEYANDVTFVYIDIDLNKNLASSYNISCIPYIHLLKIENDKLINKGEIKCENNTHETVKIIKSTLSKLIK